MCVCVCVWECLWYVNSSRTKGKTIKKIAKSVEVYRGSSISVIIVTVIEECVRVRIVSAMGSMFICAQVWYHDHAVKLLFLPLQRSVY